MSIDTSIDRRSFVKTTGALGLLSAAGVATSELFGSAPAAHASEGSMDEAVVWAHCAVDCGACCALQCHAKDGELRYVETDNQGDSSFGGFQSRACLRGRSIRRWLNSDERLNYPMKRVEGTKRGDGKYEQISWDEALDIIANEFTRIRDTYGNESIYVQASSGVTSGVFGKSLFMRLLNLCGGSLTSYGTYSWSALQWCAWPYTYGEVWGARSFRTIKDNALVVLFGSAPADTDMAGDGSAYDLNVSREQKNLKVICVDCRRSELATNQDVEWIPIVPGTDAALVAGIAHELIESGLVDIDFLHTYCVGFDEETLPEGAPANSSYTAYVMGAGYDMVEKTPAWASRITGIPEGRIIDLAHEMAEAESCFIAQGQGLQRRTNGDYGARSIMLLPQMIGQVGIPGTNSGGRQGNGGFSLPSIPRGINPIEIQFPYYYWVKAIENGPSLTAANAGVKGADKLPSSIKMIVNYANNMNANQHSDINRTTDVLRDESLCEFIVQYDVKWNESCNYADIVLPDLAPQETYSIANQGGNCDSKALRANRPLGEPKFERRDAYSVCCDLAKRLGVYDEFSEGGLTREDWCRKLWEEYREEQPQIPDYDEIFEIGVYKEDLPVEEKIEDFILDPVQHPLKTATGKMQVYAPELAELAKTSELPEGDIILPIPAYVPGFEGPGSTTDAYPLYIGCHHSKASTHSSYANNVVLQKIAPYRLWINPLDAEARGIADEDEVRVFNDRGEVRMKAKVTTRIMPGVVSMPEGGLHNADMRGDRIDYGGCINTLCNDHPNPISRGSGQHSNIGQVEKVEA